LKPLPWIRVQRSTGTVEKKEEAEAAMAGNPPPPPPVSFYKERKKIGDFTWIQEFAPS
jgi:hypothetical protein